MIKFPYGVSNFRHIRTHGYIYLDRTSAIPALEQSGEQILFLRPRRFGKSLLITTLAAYYDINHAEEFKTLFGDLAVGQNPTPEHNQYLVLQWDFSAVSPQGDIEQIKKSLFRHINTNIHDFYERYQTQLNTEAMLYPEDGVASFESLLKVVAKKGYQLYLLIDEYDNFANEVLMHNQGDKARYLALLEGEGVMKSLFKMIKFGASQKQIARVFITGVSPVVMSDMTSGYNVAKNISLHNKLTTLCGITKPELTELVTEVIAECQLDKAAIPTIMETMRQFYNGYRFGAEDNTPQVYNPILCFHFLQAYQDTYKPPRNMLDGNLAMDAGRIRYIAQLPQGQSVIDWVLEEDKNKQPAINELTTDFGIENLWRLQQDKNYMLSLMYYFGILTIQGLSPISGKVMLTIPNLLVRGLYLEQLKRLALPQPVDEVRATEIADQFYLDTNLQTVIDFIEQKYFKVFSNRDYRWSNELNIKTLFASLLFNDLYYVMDSEAELERRYSDLVMVIRPSMRQYTGLQDFVLEFKYLSLANLDLSGEELNQQSAEALAQLPVVQAALQDALQQLGHYQAVLVKKYQEPQRLHCLAVVALGFERVVWKELGND